MTAPTVNIELSRAQALVFFEWLATRSDALEADADEAERNVLWYIEGRLESLLSEPFLPEYLEIIAAAKRELTSTDDP
jgi:hypothetical protein